MSVSITAEFNSKRLHGALEFLDSGSQPARLRIYGGTRPASPDDAPGTPLLVEINLTKPAGTVSGGALSLTQAEDGLILTTGVATWARLVNGAGATAADFDCSEASGSGDIVLNTTTLYAGGYVRLTSAVLT